MAGCWSIACFPSHSLGMLVANVFLGCVMLNKSVMTNIVAGGVACLGTFGPDALEPIGIAGWFALSGAATNWLAIYMLFERIPFLYGSGIIPNKFESFKASIRSLIMEEFFSVENIEKFMEDQLSAGMDFSKLIGAIDFDMLFDKLVAAVSSSSFGPMLAMMGGEAALEPVREEFKEKAKGGLIEMTEEDSFKQKVSHALSDQFSHQDGLVSNIENIVVGRLNELTPDLVKEMIQKMIREHLGWLVIWGGVFGGLIGLVGGLFVS